MIVFTLTMPNCGSWNGRWSGEKDLFAKTMPNKKVPSEVIGKSFVYRWEDGWCALVKVEKMDCKEAAKIMRKSRGFSGYDWMIRSIIKNGEIRIEKDK